PPWGAGRCRCPRPGTPAPRPPRRSAAARSRSLAHSSGARSTEGAGPSVAMLCMVFHLAGSVSEPPGTLEGKEREMNLCPPKEAYDRFGDEAGERLKKERPVAPAPRH